MAKLTCVVLELRQQMCRITVLVYNALHNNQLGQELLQETSY